MTIPPPPQIVVDANAKKENAEEEDSASILAAGADNKVAAKTTATTTAGREGGEKAVAKPATAEGVGAEESSTYRDGADSAKKERRAHVAGPSLPPTAAKKKAGDDGHSGAATTAAVQSRHHPAGASDVGNGGNGNGATTISAGQQQWQQPQQDLLHGGAVTDTSASASTASPADNVIANNLAFGSSDTRSDDNAAAVGTAASKRDNVEECANGSDVGDNADKRERQQQGPGDVESQRKHKRRISQIIWRKKKQLVRSLQQGGCPQKERGDMLYELGSVIGKRAGEKVSSRCRQRHKGGGPCWNDGMEELSQKTYLLLGNVFKEDELAVMKNEINEKISSSGALVQDKHFGRRVARDVLADGAETVGGRVAIEGCQMLSGFIDGIKSTIDGWEDKIYTDAARLATEPDSKKKGQAKLHTDINPECIKSMNGGDPGWPVALYFPLEWQPIKLHSHKPPGRRGRDTTAKDMVVPAGSLLIFVSTHFKHSTAKCVGSEKPPMRLNVQLYGCDEIAEV